MSDGHIGDSAELYTLGLLDEAGRRRVEQHIVSCDPCLRRVGEAEETVATLAPDTGQAIPDDVPPRFERRSGASRWWIAVAAAAALLVGYLAPHASTQPPPVALAMIHSHFNHAQFSGNGPAAKVLYARDGSWYYVLVEGTHRYGVTGISAAGMMSLGTTSPADGTSQLYVDTAKQHFESIELREGSATVETAQIR